MRLLVNHMQGKIYLNIIRYNINASFATNASFASNANFKFRFRMHVIVC